MSPHEQRPNATAMSRDDLQKHISRVDVPARAASERDRDVAGWLAKSHPARRCPRASSERTRLRCRGMPCKGTSLASICPREQRPNATAFSRDDMQKHIPCVDVPARAASERDCDVAGWLVKAHYLRLCASAPMPAGGSENVQVNIPDGGTFPGQAGNTRALFHAHNRMRRIRAGQAGAAVQ